MTARFPQRELDMRRCFVRGAQFRSICSDCEATAQIGPHNALAASLRLHVPNDCASLRRCVTTGPGICGGAVQASHPVRVYASERATIVICLTQNHTKRARC